MKRAATILEEVEQVQTVQELTGIFESIASTQIARVKDRVATSKGYFAELWGLYRQLRTDPKQRLTSTQRIHNGRDVIIILTSAGGLSGSIDQRIVERTLSLYQPDRHDLVVCGSHGAQLLRQRGVRPVAVYAVPDGDQPMDVGPIIKFIRPYRHASVLYETYISLGRQEIASIDLISAVAALSAAELVDQSDVIDSRNYIFEPSLVEVVQFMEGVMLEVALGQVVLESKLAQYASRFSAMSLAQTKARELTAEFVRQYRHARRSEGDERAREVINGMKV